MIEHFPMRECLVDLNGFCRRIMNQRFSNGIVRYNGDILEHAVHRGTDISWHIGELEKWNDFARRIGAGYLYVLAPMKLDRKLEMLLPGTDPNEHDAHKTADRLMECLKLRGISALDLRPGFCDDLSEIRQNFFRTDHHWRYEAVMSAMPRVAQRIAEVSGKNLPADAAALDPRNWKKHIKRKCFLGSAGRRVGSGFAGYDDFAWYAPKFRTWIKLKVPSRKITRKGPFEKSIFVQERLNMGRSFYYSAYIGGQFDCVRTTNQKAPCAARVIFIADSYVRPMSALLSTVFQEIVVLDPRRYKKGLASFIADFHPDAVVTFVNMKYYSEEFYRFY